MLDDFWDQFCNGFSYFCWIEGVNSSHRLLRESFFASFPHRFCCIFVKALLATTFGAICFFMLEILIWGPLLEFQGFQKSPFGRNFPFEKVRKPISSNYGWRRPCFSRNHSNYFAVLTYWFPIRRFWDEDVLNFSFVLVCRCLFVYSLPYHFFSKTDGNPAAVWPSFFER